MLADKYARQSEQVQNATDAAICRQRTKLTMPIGTIRHVV